MNINDKLTQAGIKVGTREFNALGKSFCDKYTEYDSLVKIEDENEKLKQLEAITILENELVELFDSANGAAIENVYEKEILEFLYDYAKEQKQAVKEISLYVKFHKPENDRELHIHLLKNGKKIDTMIVKSEQFDKAVMTKIETLFTKTASKNGLSVSLITYDVSLSKIKENAIVIKPVIAGEYKPEVTINELINY